MYLQPTLSIRALMGWWMSLPRGSWVSALALQDEGPPCNQKPSEQEAQTNSKSTFLLHMPSPLAFSRPFTFQWVTSWHSNLSKYRDRGDHQHQWGLNILRIIWHSTFWSSVQAAHPCLRGLPSCPQQRGRGNLSRDKLLACRTLLYY